MTAFQIGISAPMASVWHASLGATYPDMGLTAIEFYGTRIELTSSEYDRGNTPSESFKDQASLTLLRAHLVPKEAIVQYALMLLPR
jgi:hypothetical protein